MPGLEALPARLLAAATPADLVSVEGLPEGVEVILRRKGAAAIVHLIDWVGEREITSAELVVNAPGTWQAAYPDSATDVESRAQPRRFPLRAFRVYDLVVAQPTEARPQ